MLSKRKVEEINRTQGFSEDIIEKILRIEELMSDIFEHPYLSKRLLIKGGTPLNFCYFDKVRLSLDIDLNYYGSVEVDFDAFVVDAKTAYLSDPITVVAPKMLLSLISSEHIYGVYPEERRVQCKLHEEASSELVS